MYVKFNDAIKEGDGARVITYWKFLLLLYKASNRTNYSVEALTFWHSFTSYFHLDQLNNLLGHDLLPQVVKKGGNIPMDLYMEHLNRARKTAVAHLGANLTPFWE